jgi:hypothetical protein
MLLGIDLAIRTVESLSLEARWGKWSFGYH